MLHQNKGLSFFKYEVIEYRKQDFPEGENKGNVNVNNRITTMHQGWESSLGYSFQKKDI